MITARRQDALHFVHGETNPIMESLFVSTKELTAGTVDLMAGARSENRSHPGEKVIFVTEGKLHVYLPESYDWFELDAWDVLYLPGEHAASILELHGKAVQLRLHGGAALRMTRERATKSRHRSCDRRRYP